MGTKHTPREPAKIQIFDQANTTLDVNDSNQSGFVSLVSFITKSTSLMDCPATTAISDFSLLFSPVPIFPFPATFPST